MTDLGSDGRPQREGQEDNRDRISSEWKFLGQLLERNQTTMDCEESPRGQMNSEEKQNKTKQKKKTLKPSVVAHAFNSSTQEEEAGRSL